MCQYPVLMFRTIIIRAFTYAEFCGMIVSRLRGMIVETFCYTNGSYSGIADCLKLLSFKYLLVLLL